MFDPLLRLFDNRSGEVLVAAPIRRRVTMKLAEAVARKSGR
jgi:hypothetical protein